MSKFCISIPMANLTVVGMIGACNKISTIISLNMLAELHKIDRYILHNLNNSM